MAVDNEDIDVSNLGFLKRVVVAWTHVALLGVFAWGIAYLMGWTPLAVLGMWVLLHGVFIFARGE